MTDDSRERLASKLALHAPLLSAQARMLLGC
jgi:hypothetical protein